MGAGCDDAFNPPNLPLGNGFWGALSSAQIVYLSHTRGFCNITLHHIPALCVVWHIVFCLQYMM